MIRKARDTNDGVMKRVKRGREPRGSTRGETFDGILTSNFLVKKLLIGNQSMSRYSISRDITADRARNVC